MTREELVKADSAGIDQYLNAREYQTHYFENKTHSMSAGLREKGLNEEADALDHLWRNTLEFGHGQNRGRIVLVEDEVKRQFALEVFDAERSNRPKPKKPW